MADSDQELTIYLRLITDQADQADQAFHNRARQRMRDTANEQGRIDKERDINLRQKISEQNRADRDAERSLQEKARASKRYDDDYVQAQRQKANAIASIEKDNFRMWKAGADVQHKQVMKDWSDQQKAAKGVGSEILNIATAYTLLRIAAEVSQAAHAALQAMGQSAAQVRDHVKSIVTEMESLRSKSTEILAMSGKPVTGANATALLMGAQRTLRDPQEYMKARQVALQYTQRFIHTPEQGEQEGRLFEWSQKMTAPLGIAAEDVSRLHEAAMQVAPRDEKGNVKEDDYKQIFSGFMRQAQPTIGATKTFLPQVATYLATHAREGDTKETLMRGAAMVSVEAQVRGPASANIYAESLQRGLRKIRTGKHGEMEETGITYEMKEEEAALKLSQYVKRQAKAELGAGASDFALRTKEDDILFNLTGEQRAFRGMEAFIERGVKQGGFAESVRLGMEAKPAELEKGQQAFAIGPEGQAKFETAKAAVQRSTSAIKYETLANIDRNSYNALLANEELEDPLKIYEQLGVKSLEQIGLGTREAQAIRAKSIQTIKSKLGGTAEGREILKEYDASKSGGFQWSNVPAFIAGQFAGGPAAQTYGERMQRGRGALGMAAGPGFTLDQLTPPKDLAKLLEDNNRELQKQTKIIEGGQPGNNVPSAHIPVAPFGGAAPPRF